MPTVSLESKAVPETSAVLLASYAQLIGVQECAFWGVNNGTAPAHACRQIWSLHDRNLVASYLAEAQAAMERVLNYPLGRRWFANEQHPYSVPVQARWGHVIAAGVRATDDIALDEAVDHTTDPAVIGPVPTTVTDEDEIHVYHHGTDAEIVPSAIMLAGGNVTIEIPRCRLVLPAYADNPATGWSYTDITVTGVFAQTVDIKRVYNDPSTQGVLVYPHGKTLSCTISCGELTQTACLYPRSLILGEFDALPATYSAGGWTPACGYAWPDLVRLNYCAGVTLDDQLRDTVVRLAHSLMPETPCGCPEGKRLWERDRNVPQILTAERLNCPFGVTDGAWLAWQVALTRRLVRGYTL